MLTLTGSFLGLMSIGVPLFIVLIGSGIIYVWWSTEVPMTIVAQRIFVGIDDFTLMAIPLFVLAGYLMNEVGLTIRLVDFARLIVGKIYGGLAHVATLVSMIFGGVTGAAAADLAAVGITLIPQMEKEGYRREFSTAAITAASLMGAVIPPSIPFIVYGVQSETSIGALFIAGIIPGILIGLVVMVTSVVVLKRTGYVTGHSAGEIRPTVPVARVLRDAIIALLMPVVIIGGIVGGVFTPTEAAGVAVFYALLAGFVVFRTLTIKKLLKVLEKASVMSAVVMMIVVASSILNWALAYSQVPAKVAEAMLSFTSSQAVFLLITVALLLVIGMPLDPVPGIIVVTPVLLPSALAFGVDPVHFGVVTVLALTLGLATPPVGASLFVGMSVGRVSMSNLSLAIAPFLAGLFALTLLITFVPATYDWLLPLLR